MVSTLTNPVVNSAVRLGTQAFDETDPVQLWPSDSLDTIETVIRAIYKQVLGNAHVMESERLAMADAESQLRSHTITVREFIRQLTKSELYRARFFEPCSRNRFIELNFKHLLGRAPNSYSDIADHSHLLESAGFKAEIDSYLDSDEYEQAFGENTVPYYRGHKSPTGQKVSGFANLLKLLRGAASNDNNVVHDQQARLNQAIMANDIGEIAPVSRPTSLWKSPATQALEKRYADYATAQFASAGPAIELGTQSFDETAPIERRPDESLEAINVVIRAVYRQVLGNAHVMESEYAAVADAESQFQSGDISVRQFVRRVAKSELYRNRFFEPCSRSRFIELNFKHLLGRAPDGYNDIANHSQILDTAGFDAEIDAYIDSYEYFQAFGENTVPYYRGHQSPTGQKVAGFANLLKLLRGRASNDYNPVYYQSQARLIQATMVDRIGPIEPVSSPAGRKLTIVESERPLTEQEKAAQQTYQGYEPFRQTPTVELLPGASADDIEVVIRAVYRQVMGNAHIMESERLAVPESQLAQGNISVREFVRQIAKSELYRSRFTDNCYRYRAMELNFKHLLGRAPQDFAEMKAHSFLLDTEGYDADIDSYINSDEYQNAFGENIVPYYRGYRTAAGQTMLEFTNMLKLLKSASSSDKELVTNNAPRVMEDILPYQPIKVSKPRDAKDILAEVFSFKAPQTAETTTPTPAPQTEQDILIAKLQEQLAALRPSAGIGASFLRQGSQPRTVIVDNSGSQQTGDKTAIIERLRGELMEAQALAAIGNSRLNKWQQRNFR